MAHTPTFVYVLRPSRAAMLAEGMTPRKRDVVERHFDYLKELNSAGIVVLAGRTLATDASAFGITLLAADSLDEARRLMEGDPAVAEGVMAAELYSFRVALGGEVPPAS